MYGMAIDINGKGNFFIMQGRRKVWKSGGARSTVVGIISPLVDIGLTVCPPPPPPYNSPVMSSCGLCDILFLSDWIEIQSKIGMFVKSIRIQIIFS